MTFEGVIKFIGPEQAVGQNNVPKITFVLEENVDREFKSSVAIDILGERTALIKQFKVGDTVKAYLNFRANEFETKWFNRISAWKLEAANAAGGSKQPTDDLPF